MLGSGAELATALVGGESDIVGQIQWLPCFDPMDEFMVRHQEPVVEFRAKRVDDGPLPNPSPVACRITLDILTEWLEFGNACCS